MVVGLVLLSMDLIYLGLSRSALGDSHFLTLCSSHITFRSLTGLVLSPTYGFFCWKICAATKSMVIPALVTKIMLTPITARVMQWENGFQVHKVIVHKAYQIDRWDWADNHDRCVHRGLTWHDPASSHLWLTNNSDFISFQSCNLHSRILLNRTVDQRKAVAICDARHSSARSGGTSWRNICDTNAYKGQDTHWNGSVSPRSPWRYKIYSCKHRIIIRANIE